MGLQLAPFSPPISGKAIATWGGLGCVGENRNLSAHPSLGRRLRPIPRVSVQNHQAFFQPTHLWEGDCDRGILLFSHSQEFLSAHPSLGRRLRLPALESFSRKLSRLAFGKPVSEVPFRFSYKLTLASFTSMKALPEYGFKVLANLLGFLTSLRFAKNYWRTPP